MNNKTGKKVLLLGSTGKLGSALLSVMPKEYEIVCHNSSSFDAADPGQVRRIMDMERPDIVFNTVAFLGIDPSEKEPERAFRINTLYPKALAEAASIHDVTLVHFSTDAVFCDRLEGFYSESDSPSPVNIYGFTKLGGDLFVRDIAPRHYIFRVSLLFGPSDRQVQFVDRMLSRINNGEKELRIADDILCSPCYSIDVATEAVRLVREDAPFGLYHIANSGAATLYELICRITSQLGCEVRIGKGSHKDFPAAGRKNTRTPIRSDKIPPLRTWQEAADEYCRMLLKDRR